MGYLPVLIPLLATLAGCLGLVGAFVANVSESPIRVYWGRLLYLAVFVVLSGSCLAMPLAWPRGVVPTCLAMAVIFLAMLWQPASRGEEQDGY